MAHGLRGDVNFSHSWEPTVSSGEKTSSAQSSQARMGMAAGSKFSNPEEANIDLISFINDDGLVVFEIQSDVQGMVGSQFNIVYDPNVIELGNVIFDTGNTLPPFSPIVEEFLLLLFSFSQNFADPFPPVTTSPLLFHPLQNIQNTSGLISFRVKEGVKEDGTQINFIIQ